MKKLLLPLLVPVISLPAFAQRSLQKLWESDSVSVKGPESALFDPKSRTLYISSMGTGSVVIMGLDGKIINKEWIGGLRSNMGSALYKDRFYTTDPTGVAVIDAAKASVIKRISIDSIGRLNDVAVDNKGVVYVSDTKNGKVYRIDDDKATLYLENMPGANGLLTVDEDLYVITTSAVHKVDAKKEITKIADGFENGLDGIVMLSPGEFIISNYTGILYHLAADGTKSVLLDTRADHLMANDISYDSKTKTLYVPVFNRNRIIAYQVK
ncbi:SMP-30/gluconolactonase/LRE family protein [Deminuibacter soli]|uniref:ATP-binding protein n=1 Tax=Deminuibacter soli TaxID=2291815 RepID=A0A3E1NKU4_9BACT|nr:SMP-30/gluconolactonase/LRE family protein [Deminuibacter soli]RFM28546.1 ATP-binding protein [Deminuibacter soli]